MTDSTDRELLEKAATAAGYKVWGAPDDDEGLLLDEAIGLWNPLTDDGDALRLAVALRIDLRFQQDGDSYVDAGRCDAWTVYLVDADGDLAAATRRAIVRAAAAKQRAVEAEPKRTGEISPKSPNPSAEVKE